MNGYNFTEKVRKALAMAREEAVRLRHAHVGTEHLLLGLLGDDTNTAVAILDALSLEPDEVRREVENLVKHGRPDEVTGPDLPYATRAKKVLELAMSEARELDHSHVGTEHLLLGLLREEKGIAAQALRARGATLDGARDAMFRTLGAGAPGASSASELLALMSATRPARPISIAIEVQDADGRLRHRARFGGTREALAFLEAVRLACGE